MGTRATPSSALMSWRAVALTVVLVFHSAAAAAQTPTELPGLEGALFSSAADVNAIGEAVGISGGHAVLWDRSGSLIPLPEPAGATGSRATGINSVGTIVGYADIEGDARRAVLWTAKLVPRLLAPLHGATGSWANAINNKGEVIGTSVGGPFGVRAVIWDRKGAPRALPLPAGAVDCRGSDLNNKGEACGTCIPNGATAWSREGEPQALPLEDDAFPSSANAINDKGLIVGRNEFKILLWPPQGGYEIFDRDGEAEDIDNRGRLVGVYGDIDEYIEPYDAARWTRKGLRILLDPLPDDTDSYAFGMNAYGVIVGISVYKLDEYETAGARAVIWR